MHLTAEQDGIYRRLIDHYMETELPLPDNDMALARIAGVSPESFAATSSTLRLFFKQQDGKLYHKKCDEVLEDMNRRYQKNQEKGKRGGEAKAKKYKQKQEPASSSKEQVELDSSKPVPPYLTLPNPTVLKKEKINKKENFKKFYEAYPLKQGRGKAEKAFEKVDAPIETLLAAIATYRKNKPDWQEYAHPASWLNQKRWEDEYEGKPKTTEWPEWKHNLAKRIGESNVVSWFGSAEFKNGAIIVPQKFQADRIRDTFSEDIAAIFGSRKEIIVQNISRETTGESNGL